MPNATRYDLDFRPATYWETADPLTALLINVKGTRRREMIRDIASGEAARWIAELVRQGAVPSDHGAALTRAFTEVDPDFLVESLPHDRRIALGWIHPSFMGGEYLPDYLPGEVEIARVELASVTADVTSFRARRRGKRILYRIVDEYATAFAFPRRSSVRPLTMGQFIALINGTSYADEDPKWFVRGFTSGLREGVESPDFVRVSSDFYPRLADWYADEALEWTKQVAASRQGTGGGGALGSGTEAPASNSRESLSHVVARRRSA